MTLAAVPRKSGPHAGTGAPASYPYNFRIETANDLLVLENRTVVPSSAYSVTGVGNENGGEVQLTAAQGSTVWIFGNLPLEQQDINLPGNGAAIHSSNLELFGDKSVMREWERFEQLERRPALHQSTTLRNLEWPAPVALKLLGWNATADGLALYDPAVVTSTPDPVTNEIRIKTVVTGNAVAGQRQITVPNAFPVGTEAIHAVGRITVPFGTSNGLTAIQLGDPDYSEQAWTASMGILLDDISNVGMHQQGLPRLFNANARGILVTGIGGNFDAVGEVKITTLSIGLTPDT